MEFNFAESKEVESLEKVPVDFRALYEEKDGKFFLSQDEKVKSSVSAVMRLNDALKAARAEAKNKGVKVDLSPLADYGTSPEEIAAGVKAKLDALETAAAGSKEAKLNLDKVKEELSKAHAKDSQVRDGKITALRGQLDKIMIENQAKSAIAEIGGDAATIEILMPHLAPNVKSVEEDGEYKVFVVDKSGDKRYSGSTGEPMSIKELVAEFKGSDKFGKLFPSEAPNGGGVRPGSGEHRGMPPQKGELTANQKIAAGLNRLQK
jgi:hypothetical protein